MRIMWGCWWWYSLIIVTVWTGNIISLLAVQIQPVPFSTYEEMIAQDEYTFGGQGKAYFEEFMQNQTSGYKKRLWGKVVQFNKTDPEVLSPFLEVHINKVIKTSKGTTLNNSQ